MLLSLTFCVLLNCPTRQQRFPETISGARRERAFAQVYESRDELTAFFLRDSIRMFSMNWLNNTTVTLGMENVFDEDPPFLAGSGENGYDESLATIKGRFSYIQLKKRF
jgi:hypothetical protein